MVAAVSGRSGYFPSRGARGVSLLEMLLVIALIAAASLLAVAVLSGGMDGMRLRSSAKQIAAELRYTRAHAIATGQPQVFTIDPVAHEWRAPNGRKGVIPASLSVQFTGARQAQPRAGVGAIKFFEDGASTGGRIDLQARQALWRVDVAWLTGQVTLKRPDAEQAL